MAFKYSYDGAFGYHKDDIKDYIMVGVGDNNEDPYVIKDPKAEDIKKYLDVPQYMGMGMVVTLKEVLVDANTINDAWRKLKPTLEDGSFPSDDVVKLASEL